MTQHLAPIRTLAKIIVDSSVQGQTFVVGITGSVAAGKSTLAGVLATALSAARSVAIVSSDGFLLPNRILEENGLLARKGYPETFDTSALIRALQSVRRAPTIFPGYSHDVYDVDPELAREIQPGALLLIEGLGLPPGGDPSTVDLTIYIDADESDLEFWYVERFLDFWRAASSNPNSFYRRFLHLDEAGVTALAGTVWTNINLPNLRQNIIPAKDRADIVIRKSRNHQLSIVRAQSG